MRDLRLVSLLLLVGCASPAPEAEDPVPATGPCFEANLMDGIQDGEEIAAIFACFNEYGAFNDLAPLVAYLADDGYAKIQSVTTAASELLGTFDVVGALEIGARLVLDEDAPLTRATDLYVEAVDADLLRPGVGLAREASAAMIACEQSDNRGACSVPRLARYLLDTEVIDDLGIVLDAAAAQVDEDARTTMLLSTATLLYSASTVNPDKTVAGNPLLDTGRFLLDDTTGEGAPIERLAPYLPYLLSDDLDGDGDADLDPDDDNLLAAMARPLGAAVRDGTFEAMPSELIYLFRHDSDGNEVAWGEPNIVDELLAASADLTSDPTLLTDPITLPDGTESTLLDVMLDTLDDVYLSGADVGEITTTLGATVDTICGPGSDSALCDLAGDLLPPATAAVNATPQSIHLLLGLAYELHRTADASQLIDLMMLALDLDLMNQTRDMTIVTLQICEENADRCSLGALPTVLPIIVDPTLGRLTGAGKALQRAGLILLSPQDFDGDGETNIPALVPLDVARAALNPEYANADLDFLLGTVGGLMLDRQSGLYPENLTSLLTDLQEDLGQQDVDLLQTARDALDNEDLWTSALDLGADPGLADLLVPIEGRAGAPWYLYDLIERGTLGDMLTLAANLFDKLIDNDFIDGPATERSSAAPSLSPKAPR